ncbi:MAG: indole-3-glycerol phosphate synthase TrpC [Oscillospiraceae bacterium]|nr:indole-3-glycerol phosphate synthase TrpC [Oscillospiraceae bacterium]
MNSPITKHNILEEICEYTKTRIEKQKSIISLEAIKEKALTLPKGDFALETALKTSKKSGEIAFICEVKKASPSKGIIAEDFDYIEIAKNYEKSGAAAISVLTEPNWFKGSDAFLKEINTTVKTPLLRKDFTVCEYMIYEAKLLGASAILLICSVLDSDTISRYIKIAARLGLCSLVETHDEDEIKTALNAGAKIIGVNNRNLKTFEVDITLSERLRKLVPPEVAFVAESGIKTREDIHRLKQAGVDAVLIGETLMRGKSLEALR